MAMKKDYGYIERQVIFLPPRDYAGIPSRHKMVYLKWIGGGWKRIKKLDPNIPTQFGNPDWGYSPAVLP